MRYSSHVYFVFHLQFVLSTLLFGSSLGAFIVDVSEAKLEKALEKYRDIVTLESKFTQIKKLVDTEITLKSEGQLKVIAPDTIVWQIDKPSRIVVTLRTKEIQIESGEGSSKSIQKFKRNEKSKSEAFEKDIQALMMWLKFDPHALISDYKITQSSSEVFAFEPKHLMIFKHIELHLASSGYVREMLLTENSGDTLDIFFDHILVKRKEAPKAR